MSYADDEVEELVKEACDIESGLTDWEMNFVEDMAKRLEARLGLTPPMVAKLKQIVEERG